MKITIVNIVETVFFIVIFFILIKELVLAVKRKDDTSIKVQLVKIAIAIIITIAIYAFNP